MLAVSVVAILVGYGIVTLVYCVAMAVVARAFGVGVKVVSVGLGPRIWTHCSDRWEFQLKLIPVGGWIRLADEENEGPVEERFSSASWSTKSLVFLAGPVSSFLVGSLLLATPVWSGGTQIVVIPGSESALHHSGLGPLVVSDQPASYRGQLELFDQTAWQILVRLLTFQSLGDFSGPVGWVRTAAEAGRTSLFAAVSLIGVAAWFNALSNLLPIPTLNGGHLVLLPVYSERIRIGLSYIGLGLIGLLLLRLVLADVEWYRSIS